jgi:aerobic C4-dicarboxylate transport protein
VPQPPASKRRDTLYLQVLAGAAAGVAIGVLWPHFGAQLRPLALGFVSLVRMLITPIIFLTVVGGIAGMTDLKKIGWVGGGALLYFEVVTTIALAVGLAVSHVLRPGAGMHVPLSSLDPQLVAGYVTKAKSQTLTGLFLHIIPDSFAGAFVDNDLLQVLLISLLFGFALSRLGESARPVVDLVHRLTRVFFTIVGFVTRLAPLAALGSLAFTVGSFGAHTLVSLLELLLCMAGTCLVFVFVVLWAIARLRGFSLWRILRHIREELFIAVSTSASETALPGLMQKMEAAGCPREVVGIVVPAGYSFNLDGTCIYLTLASVFLAQATDAPLTFWGELGLLAVLLIYSKGAAGVTGSGFITLAATLASTGRIPVASMALILGIDPFMSEMRTFTNLIGNTVGTLVVASYDPAFDRQRAQALLGAGPKRD